MTLSVAVDDREPEAVGRAVEAHPDVTAVEVRRLPAADIAAIDPDETGDAGSVLGAVGIERKTVADYANSAIGTSGTDLREQVLKMGEVYDRGYVLLEGDLADVGADRPGLDAASVHGTMASFAARHDTPVLPCSDRERLVDVAIRLLRKHREDPSPRPLAGGSVTGYATPRTKRLFGCIEGVGPRTADALYEAFPSVEALLAATPAELREVEGVGEKRAEAIVETLRGQRD
ncbi:helix-hairpin-helix domain-containing protein [Halorussus gelatinilyticus]|uniref:Helix-hairpin-helix domain-containing protein n=1 Tax=Halorussus gelatinilyticus TaxID=2937524 RepID=A0A8U0IJL4_9EURY|nr:helix-hairpin-helix domain-containing protein [Halorussus gelatinilyticus]UPW01310.1 helix-hairpin-helix domain-containing protein [Halorussus gelatinilyticus]